MKERLPFHLWFVPVLLFVLSGCQGANSESSLSSESSSSETSASESSSISSSEDTTLQDAKAAIEAALPTEISGDFLVSVPSEYASVSVTMSSSNPAILTDEGTFTTPENDTMLTLTIALTYRQENDSIVHDVLAKGIPLEQKMAEIQAQLTIEDTSVVDDFVLPTSTLYGALVSWTSSDASYISIVGLNASVFRPSEKFLDEVVTVTATILIGTDQSTKTFEITVESLNVVAIEMATPFAQTRYPQGASTLDVTGGTLHITLDDASSKEVSITPEMISGFSTESVGPSTVTITYGEASTETVVTIYQASRAETLALNASKSEDFESDLYPQLAYDNAQTPLSGVTADDAFVLSGERSLLFSSDGNYKTLYLKDFVDFEADYAYRFSFDYKILSFVDTVYFQISGPNVFTQFGSASQINQVRHFTWIYSSPSSSSLIQLFPGSGVGLTQIVIDDFMVERIFLETNDCKTTLNVGDTVKETFGDFNHRLFNIDTAPTPNSMVDNVDAIDGYSLFLNSNGSYSGLYLVPNSGWLPIGNYKLTFDYKLFSLVDTIYFQYYNNGTVGGFTQFGQTSDINSVRTFEFTLTLTSSTTVFQMFPGGGTGTTRVAIDNLVIERLVD